MKTTNWTFRKGSEPHHQALVYNEDTGEDVAVIYNDEGGKHAAVIAAAPDLLDALISIQQTLEQMVQDENVKGMLYAAEIAINKASNP